MRARAGAGRGCEAAAGAATPVRRAPHPRARRRAPRLAAALLAAVALGGCERLAGGGPSPLEAHVDQYCEGFASSLRVASRSVRQGELRSVGLGPIRRGTAGVLNQRMHFCAGAREGWGEPSSPAMAAAQDFSELADRLEALFVAAGDEPPPRDRVAGLLEEMAALADDVAELPLRTAQ
jgi:hypothetical protein